MVVASNLDGVSNAIGPTPSDISLRSLDAVNLLLAGALSGFGPYVAVFLAEQKWSQQNIGLVLTAAGFAGLLTQLPAGELLDAIRSKRIAVALGAAMVAAGALIIASWPSFPLVLTALVLQAITGGFLGLAVAAISLGLVGHAALGERLGRNQRFASTGGVLAAGLMGLIGYFLSYRAIFLVAAALVLPLLFALGRIQPSDIHFGRACGVPDHHGASAPPRTRRRSVWMDRGLLTFAGC
jgi:MFS family permease